MTPNLVSQRDLTAYVESRGYRTERIFNTIAVAQDGADLRVMGLTLIGPRRNRGCVPLSYGYGDLDAAKLWCDGVDYASRHIAGRRTIRARRRAA